MRFRWHNHNPWRSGWIGVSYWKAPDGWTLMFGLTKWGFTLRIGGPRQAH